MAKKTTPTTKTDRPSITTLRKSLSKGGYREKAMSKAKGLKVRKSTPGSSDGVFIASAPGIDFTVSFTFGNRNYKNYTVVA